MADSLPMLLAFVLCGIASVIVCIMLAMVFVSVVLPMGTRDVEDESEDGNSGTFQKDVGGFSFIKNLHVSETGISAVSILFFILAIVVCAAISWVAYRK